MPLIETKTRVFPFTYKVIWFSGGLYDADGCDSVIYRLCKNKVEEKGFRCTDEYHTLVIDLTQDLEAIWQGMSKTNVRKPVSHAIKSGVEIRKNENYEAYYAMYDRFRKERGFKGSDISIEYMKRYGTLLTSVYGGEVLGGMFFLEDEDNIVELTTASRRLDMEKRNFIGGANKLLVWEAIQYAKNKGIKEYDRGGFYAGGIRDEGLERINLYKKSFGGRPATKYNYRKDYSLPARLLKKYLLKN